MTTLGVGVELGMEMEMRLMEIIIFSKALVCFEFPLESSSHWLAIQIIDSSFMELLQKSL